MSPLFRLFSGFLAFLVLSCVFPHPAFTQRELVPVDHPIYNFLLRQQLEGHIQAFTWEMLPLPRVDVARFLETLRRDSIRATLSPTDNQILADYCVEFSQDLDNTSEHLQPFIPEWDVTGIFSDEQQKSLYTYRDSTTSLVIDLLADLSRRDTWGDSLGKGHATLGEVGIRFRGTLHDRLGFYLQATNGSLLNGSHSIALIDNRLRANNKFNSPEASFFDFTKGYLRYDIDWLSVMAGREQILWGAGYADRAVFSDNTVPFDYFRIDLRSGGFRYAFLHGSLVGADSTGHTLSSKYIASHRVEFNVGSRVRIGLSEAVLYSNQPVNFALMNPFTFLTSAELSTEMPQKEDNAHNTLMWLDVEVTPMKDLRTFGSLLVDDLKFSTIGKNDISGNSNKFGWQGGILWNDAFGLPTLVLTTEYTRINPFVLTHWTNFNSYTNWGLSLGPSLPPNSDEWLFQAEYAITHRLSVRANVRFQRSGENILDANGN
ncbi:MAG: capsule assembly Wzi family protein, partial [Bacteroidota bacterium]